MNKESTKEELTKLKEEVLTEIAKIKGMSQRKYVLQLAYTHMLFQNDKYQGLKTWLLELQKGLTTGESNYKQVLEGIKITSNFMTEENVRILLEQKQEASTYMTLYNSYLQAGKEKVNQNQEFENDIAPSIKQEMDIKSKKVKQLSKQYINNVEKRSIRGSKLWTKV